MNTDNNDDGPDQMVTDRPCDPFADRDGDGGALLRQAEAMLAEQNKAKIDNQKIADRLLGTGDGSGLVGLEALIGLPPEEEPSSSFWKGLVDEYRCGACQGVFETNETEWSWGDAYAEYKLRFPDVSEYEPTVTVCDACYQSMAEAGMLR